MFFLAAAAASATAATAAVSATASAALSAHAATAASSVAASATSFKGLDVIKEVLQMSQESKAERKERPTHMQDILKKADTKGERREAQMLIDKGSTSLEGAERLVNAEKAVGQIKSVAAGNAPVTEAQAKKEEAQNKTHVPTLRPTP